MIYIDATRAVEVRIYHNVNEDSDGRRTSYIDGWKAGDPIVHVATWYSSIVDDDNAVRDAAWRIFNVGDDPEFGKPNPVALEYRDRRNRSLSMGDVVQIGHLFYVCQDIGWKMVGNLGDLNIVRRHVHGTTPVPLTS